MCLAFFRPSLFFSSYLCSNCYEGGAALGFIKSQVAHEYFCLCVSVVGGSGVAPLFGRMLEQIRAPASACSGVGCVCTESVFKSVAQVPSYCLCVDKKHAHPRLKQCVILLSCYEPPVARQPVPHL